MHLCDCLNGANPCAEWKNTQEHKIVNAKDCMPFAIALRGEIFGLRVRVLLDFGFWMT
jgi:hypothetical protein